MKRIRTTASTAIVAMCLFAATSVCWALSEGRGAGGEPYVTGGVGEEERAALVSRRPDYNLSITTVANRSGAYLSDARVNVVDAAKRQVLSAALDGPLLLMRLPPGRYTIEALFDQQKQERAVAVPAEGRRQVYFYFDVMADTLPRESEAGDAAPRRKP